MSQYNHIERYFARILRKFPLVKNALKFAYSRLSHIIYRESYRYKSRYVVKKVFGVHESFFGYYDHSPSRENYCIINVADFDTKKKVCLDNSVSIKVVDLEKNTIVFEASSSAFNLQQGPRAHWLTNDTLAFNTHNPQTKKLTSAIANIASGDIKYMSEHCIQASHKDEFYISINYQRLAHYRPDYGYLTPDFNPSDLLDLVNDGLFQVDYNSGDAELLVSLNDIISRNNGNSKISSTHWFNHVMISPNGEQMIFLHRFILNGMRVDHLYLYNFATRACEIINPHGMVSHCCWIGDDTVFGFMRGPTGIEKFHNINCNTGVMDLISSLDSYSDGHPSCIGDYVVFDTYPGKNRMQKLFIYNYKTHKITELGDFFHGFEFRDENRCDLHPRLSTCGTKVYFDSVFDGSRQLYSLELS